MKLSHTRHETRETPTKQASKQREATRSNKKQSMKEQRTAPPSLLQPTTLTRTHAHVSQQPRLIA